MRKHHSLSLSLLVPALFVITSVAVIGVAVVGVARAQEKAQQKSSPTPKPWSDASTWPDKKVPAADALVTIDKDMNVLLDVTPPPLRGLTINGKLSFADNKDIELTTEWIML